MSTMIETLKLYLQYPFVRYALIVGVLIALCSSLLGVTLVLKRFSFIGDGLSHVAFGAMAVAAVLNLSDSMLFVLPATVLCAILLLRTGQNLSLIHIYWGISYDIKRILIRQARTARPSAGIHGCHGRFSAGNRHTGRHIDHHPYRLVPAVSYPAGI